MSEFHFWNFKSNYCIGFRDSYKKSLFKLLLGTSPLNKIAELSKIDESTLREFKNKRNRKIEIRSFLKLICLLKENGMTLNLENIEKQISWMGPHTGIGISKPKLPFRLNTPEFAKILAAIYGDGTITNKSGNSTKYKLGSMEYWNENSILRRQLILAAINVFGGARKEYKETPNRNSVCLKFPTPVRDVVILQGEIQGEKSVLNSNIPDIVLNSKDPKTWIEWLRQSFDDEGSVRFRDNYNHEIFLTRVMDITGYLKRAYSLDTKTSFNKLPKDLQTTVKRNPVNLLLNEKNLLERLSVSSVLRPQEVYITKTGRMKVKWRLYITRKTNIRRFLQVIGFNSLKKMSILNKIVGDKTEINPQDKRNGLESEIGAISQREMGKRETIPIRYKNKEKSFRN